MKKWPPIEYVFTLLDFADELVPRIKDDEMFMHQYFITLIQIEYVLDSYGRGLVRYAARDEGRADAEELFTVAEQRMDALRVQLRVAAQTHDFDDTIREYTEMVSRDWKRLPDDHPNVLALKEKGLL
jgi:hypothetical protein